jgi:hypothetical protein
VALGLGWVSVGDGWAAGRDTWAGIGGTVGEGGYHSLLRLG